MCYIGPLSSESYSPGLHISEGVPQASAINIINVECMLRGTYRDGKRSNYIVFIYPSAHTSYKINRETTEYIIPPGSVQEVSNVISRSTDQSENLIHLKNEKVTIHRILQEIQEKWDSCFMQLIISFLFLEIPLPITEIKRR